MQNPMSNSNRQELFDLPVNPDVLFADHKNIYKERIEKRQRKMLNRIPFIRPFLHESETILCVTTGCSPVSLIEQFMTGWIVFYLKRSLFVFTNERIFHIPTKHDFSYRNSLAQIVYADCKSIAIKGRNLVAEYKNGKKEKFLYIPRSESKKIKTLLQEMSLEGQPSSMLSRTHLCPRCTNLLATGQYTCPSCSLEFKNKKQTKRISIIYPGGGYFYTGHPFLGLGDALAEIYLTLLVIAALAAAISGAAGGISALVFFGIILTLEKALTVYHSNHFIKEYIPKDHCIRVLTGEPNTQQPAEAAAEPKTEEILSASWNNQVKVKVP
jgi:hypothetical protein